MQEATNIPASRPGFDLDDDTMDDDFLDLPPKSLETVDMTLRLPQDVAASLEVVVNAHPGYNRHEVIVYWLRQCCARTQRRMKAREEKAASPPEPTPNKKR